METNELHRGRLIDHLQLVVEDLPACRRFYEAVLATLRVPIGGSEDSFFWADELFVSALDSEAAQGRPTDVITLHSKPSIGRWWMPSMKRASTPVEATTALQENGLTTPDTTLHSFWIQQATTSKQSTTARQIEAQPRLRLPSELRRKSRPACRDMQPKHLVLR